MAMVREQAKFFWDDAWGPQPFTPSVPASTGSGQAAAVTAASAALPQGSAPAVQHVVAALEVPAAPQGASSAQPVSGGAGVVQNIGTNQSASLTTSAQVGASLILTSGSTGAADDSGSGALHASLPDGWLIVPSAANEYGQSYAAGDGFVWDVAAGEFSADWFFV